jgi:UDP-N-acetylenolpyruvoylglucosamine reductase
MIYTDYNLQPLLTFNTPCIARKVIEIQSEKDLDLLTDQMLNDRIVILSGGSNILFEKSVFEGTVLLIRNQGVRVIKEDSQSVVIQAQAGQRWRDFVVDCCNKGWWGVENLSAIYGNVGAVCVQNIGAYGCEVKDTVLDCTTYNPRTKHWRTYTNSECDFDYRYSIFKYPKELEIIWSVRFLLSKQPRINLTYKALYDEVARQNINITTPLQVSQLVTHIRDSKLPNPQEFGNCGSFFKNPVISPQEFVKLKTCIGEENIPAFKTDKGIKLSAAWLIERDGWKGKRVGNVGMHSAQALVMVNYGGASSEEPVDLSNKIIASIKSHFGITLQREVHII